MKKTLMVVITLLLVWCTPAYSAGPAKPDLAIPDGPPKIYNPADSKGTWISLVNYLMTLPKWHDDHGNEVYHKGFYLKHADDTTDHCTLSYNHSNGTLSMTITQIHPTHSKIYGKGNVLKTVGTKAVTTLTMTSIDFDTRPDLVLLLDVVLDENATRQVGATIVWDTVPKQEMFEHKDRQLVEKELKYLSVWGTWEIHIMKTLGFKTVIKKEKKKL